MSSFEYNPNTAPSIPSFVSLSILYSPIVGSASFCPISIISSSSSVTSVSSPSGFGAFAFTSTSFSTVSAPSGTGYSYVNVIVSPCFNPSTFAVVPSIVTPSCSTYFPFSNVSVISMSCKSTPPTFIISILYIAVSPAE